MKKLLMSVGLASSLSACGPTSCVARGSRVRTPTGPRQWVTRSSWLIQRQA